MQDVTVPGRSRAVEDVGDRAARQIDALVLVADDVVCGEREVVGGDLQPQPPAPVGQRALDARERTVEVVLVRGGDALRVVLDVLPVRAEVELGCPGEVGVDELIQRQARLGPGELQRVEELAVGGGVGGAVDAAVRVRRAPMRGPAACRRGLCPSPGGVSKGSDVTRGELPFPPVSFAAGMIGRPRRREQRGNRWRKPERQAPDPVVPTASYPPTCAAMTSSRRTFVHRDDDMPRARRHHCCRAAHAPRPGPQTQEVFSTCMTSQHLRRISPRSVDRPDSARQRGHSAGRRNCRGRFARQVPALMRRRHQAGKEVQAREASLSGTDTEEYEGIYDDPYWRPERRARRPTGITAATLGWLGPNGLPCITTCTRPPRPAPSDVASPKASCSTTKPFHASMPS